MTNEEKETEGRIQQSMVMWFRNNYCTKLNNPKCEIAELFAIAALSKSIPAKCNIVNPPNTATNCQPNENRIKPLISCFSSPFAIDNVLSAK